MKRWLKDCHHYFNSQACSRFDRPRPACDRPRTGVDSYACVVVFSCLHRGRLPVRARIFMLASRATGPVAHYLTAPSGCRALIAAGAPGLPRGPPPGSALPPEALSLKCALAAILLIGHAATPSARKNGRSGVSGLSRSSITQAPPPPHARCGRPGRDPARRARGAWSAAGLCRASPATGPCPSSTRQRPMELFQ